MKKSKQIKISRNINSSFKTYFAPFFIFRIFLLLFLTIGFVSCQQFNFSDRFEHGLFPYKFQIQQKIDRDSYIFDLDHNGDDEFVILGNKNFQFNKPARIQIRDSEYALIEEVNFNGMLQRPYAFDWNEDGDDEILMPYVRSDSLFIQILNWRGKKLKQAFLFAANNFPDRNKNYVWMGNISSLLWHDLDGDANNELIFFFSEGHARAPRGVFVYEGNTLALRWKYEIGPAIPSVSYLIDSNNDGYMEILFPTSAPCNGYQKNGTDDQHSYLFLLDYQGQLIWRSDVGGRYTVVDVKHIDLDGDDNKEIISYFYDNSQAESPPRLDIIHPENGIASQSLTLPIQSAGWAILNFDRDVQQEIAVLGNDGKIFLLDHQLNTLRTRDLGVTDGSLYHCEDLDQDGRDEIIIVLPNGVLCLDNNLEVKAKYSKIAVVESEVFVYHKRKAKPLIALSDTLRFELASLEKNPYYLVSYYGTIVGAILIIMFFASLVFFLITWHQKAQRTRIIFEKIAASCQLPFYVIDHRSHVRFANLLGMGFLKTDTNRLPLRLSSLPPGQQNSEPCQFLMSLREAEAIHQEKKIRLTESPHGFFLLIAEPLLEWSKKKRNWLVIIKRSDEGLDYSQAQTWMAMAQRIAHEIKNPLTSILLTLQRMQMEYHDQESEHAANYDHYTEKIIERIEALRRTSRQFMKFVNLEKINLQPTNINQLIEAFLSRSIVIPKDIQLQKTLSADVPTIHLDQEQIQSVLENLITNAINAMPDGGRLTIATSLVPNLHLRKEAQTTSDYVLIEIMDTGVGIPDEIKNKLFQPYVSNSLTGTGLGLTIAKKIVDDHSGIIEFTTEKNMGTSFMIYLPVA